MKKSLIVATLAVLLSVNVLTPISYATGDLSENDDNMSSWMWNTQDSSVTPQNDDNTPSWTEGEGSYEWQIWNQLDSSVTPQNDGSDEQVPQNDDSDAQDSSLDAQNDNQDDTANPEDLLAMPLAGPMQFGPDPDPQPEEPQADPNADPATPDEDSDDTSTQRSTEVKDLHLYFVNGSETKHYTIMDRNMWATGVNQWWYYYQWWNNWWFDHPLSGTTTTQVPYNTWHPYEAEPSTYSSSTFVKHSSNWQSAISNSLKTNSNLWWWKDDTTLKDWDLNRKKRDRQWPCATGYYVPSAYDAYSLIWAWTWSSPYFDITKANTSESAYDKFASDLLFVIDEYISANGILLPIEGGLWTSSPATGLHHGGLRQYNLSEEANNARIMYFKPLQFWSGNSVGIQNKSNWRHVRCFKNTFKPDGSEQDNAIQLKIELNGGEKTVIAVDADRVVKTLNSPEKDDYDFIWWYTTPDFQSWTEVHIGTQIQKGATLYAKWEYYVNFVDYDWTELLPPVWYTGGTLAADITKPADPTRAEDAKCVYTFTGWDPAIADVTDDVTYTAQYDCEVKSYTITWKNDDGSVIDTWLVEYWTVPTHADATKENTAEWTYTFSGWTPSLAAVAWDAEYMATYSATVNEYMVTFLDEDGTELYKYNVPYGMMPLYTGDIPTKEADSKFTYTFAGWTPSLAAVTGEATYTVKFNSKKKWGNRSGGWKWGNSDSEPTHGSADDERPQNYPDAPADTPVDEPKWEIFDVHKWAYENWLTKFGDINDARMNDPITRSEMAKISSIFDTNFLGKTPDESKESECSSYPDIQNMGGDLYYFVVQSCELKNMWYHYDNENHIENFMPYNPLNVAQASVILSRMAWWKKYIIGPEKWYQWHMYAVYEHVLIDDTSDPWRHITRREAFTAFYRLDKLLKEKK